MRPGFKCIRHGAEYCPTCTQQGGGWIGEAPVYAGARGNEFPNGYPDDNPKTAVGSTKIPLHLIPPAAKHMLAEAMADGAKKYGPYNWREKRVTATTYIAAALRHIDAYLDGENVAHDSMVHHLAHAMACCAIVIDAQTLNKLNDDRPTKGAAPTLQAMYAERHRPNPVSQTTGD